MLGILVICTGSSSNETQNLPPLVQLDGLQTNKYSCEVVSGSFNQKTSKKFTVQLQCSLPVHDSPGSWSSPSTRTGRLARLRHLDGPTGSAREADFLLNAGLGNVEFVRFYLNEGVDVNARDDVRNETALHKATVASQSSRVEILRVLVEYGGDVNAADVDGDTPLHVAAERGRADGLQVLLESERADVDVLNGAGWTPLHLAAKRASEEHVQLLLAHRADPNALGAGGISPLLFALDQTSSAELLLLAAAQLSVSEALLDAGARVNQTDVHWRTALMAAASSLGHLGVVRLLLDRGADMEIQALGGGSALMFATDWNRADIVHLLLERGAEIERTNWNNWTALHYTVDRDNVDAARVLLDHEPNVDPRSRAGFTPLILAARYNRPELAQLLLDHGANARAVTLGGSSGLHEAAVRGYVQLGGILIDAGADVNVTAPRPQPDCGCTHCPTPLHFASRCNQPDFVALLLRNFANVNALSPVDGSTPLLLAADGGRDEVAVLLLDAGADVHAVFSSNRKSALHAAAENGHAALIDLLLQRGARPNVRDSEGWTPFRRAIERGKIEAATLLFRRGGQESQPYSSTRGEQMSILHLVAAKGETGLLGLLLEQEDTFVDPQDSEGNTPLCMAAKGGHSDAVQILLSKGADPNVEGGGRDGQTGERELRTPLFIAASQPAAVTIQGGFTLEEIRQPGGGTSSVNYTRTVEVLIDGGASVTVTDYEGATVLHAAAASCDSGRLRLLLRHFRELSLDPFVQGERDARTGNTLGWTALHVAAKTDCPSGVRLLLQDGEEEGSLNDRKVQVQDAYGLTAFHIAARFWSAGVLRVLMEARLVPVNVESSGRTAFHLAAAGPLISDPSYRGEGHRLSKALSFEEQLKTLRLLKDFNGSARALDGDVLTPLHLAAQEGRGAAVRFFVDEAGLDVDVSGGKGEDFGVTPLMLAVRGGHREAVKALLDQGASSVATTQTGRTPTHFAAAFEGLGGSGNALIVSQIIQRLVESSDDRLRSLSMKTTDWRKEKPLHVAVRTGTSAPLVETLLDEERKTRISEGSSPADAVRAVLETPDGVLRTPLLVAAREGHLEVLSLLVRKGGDFAVRGEEGNTLLHMAVESGRFEMVAEVQRIFKENDVDTNRADWSGGSPVHVASAMGRHDIVKLLVEEGGAGVNSLRADEASPVLLSARRGSLPTLQLLVEKGAVGLLPSFLHPSVPLASLELISRNATQADLEDGQSGAQLYVQRASRPLDSFESPVRNLFELGAQNSRDSGEGDPLQSERERRDAAIVAALSRVEETVPRLSERLKERLAVDWGPTALQLAAFHGHTKAARFLLKRGADGNLSAPTFLEEEAGQQLQLPGNVSILSPLLLAASSGHTDIAVELLRHKADARSRGNLRCGGESDSSPVVNRTALHCAGSQNMSRLVSVLFAAGADGIAKDGLGRTALMLAAQSGALEAVKSLSARQRDEQFLALDNEGRHAHDFAVAGNHTHVQRWLESEDEKEEWDDCSTVECPEGQICVDPQKGFWSREPISVLCRPPSKDSLSDVLLGGVKDAAGNWLVWAQTGLLGFLVLAACVVLFILPRTCVKKWKDLDPPMRPMAVFGVISQINNLWGDGVFIATLCLLVQGIDPPQSSAAEKGAEISKTALLVLLPLTVTHLALGLGYNLLLCKRLLNTVLKRQKLWWRKAKEEKSSSIILLLSVFSLKFSGLFASNLCGIPGLSLRILKDPDAQSEEEEEKEEEENDEKEGEGKENDEKKGEGRENGEKKGEGRERDEREADGEVDRKDEEKEEKEAREGGEEAQAAEDLKREERENAEEASDQENEEEGEPSARAEETAEVESKGKKPSKYLTQKETERVLFRFISPSSLFEDVPQLALRTAFFLLGGPLTLSLVVSTAFSVLSLVLLAVEYALSVADNEETVKAGQEINAVACSRGETETDEEATAAAARTAFESLEALLSSRSSLVALAASLPPVETEVDRNLSTRPTREEKSEGEGGVKQGGDESPAVVRSAISELGLQEFQRRSTTAGGSSAVAFLEDKADEEVPEEEVKALRSRVEESLSLLRKRLTIHQSLSSDPPRNGVVPIIPPPQAYTLHDSAGSRGADLVAEDEPFRLSPDVPFPVIQSSRLSAEGTQPPQFREALAESRTLRMSDEQLVLDDDAVADIAESLRDEMITGNRQVKETPHS